MQKPEKLPIPQECFEKPKIIKNSFVSAFYQNYFVTADGKEFIQKIFMRLVSYEKYVKNQGRVVNKNTFAKVYCRERRKVYKDVIAAISWLQDIGFVDTIGDRYQLCNTDTIEISELGWSRWKALAERKQQEKRQRKATSKRKPKLKAVVTPQVKVPAPAHFEEVLKKWDQALSKKVGGM